MKDRPFVTAGLLAALLLVAAGCGEDGSVSSSSSSSTSQDSSAPVRISAADRSWAVATHRGDLAEIAAGKLARSKGTSHAIRAMGKKLVTDHSRLDARLLKTTGALTLALPSQASDAQRKAGKKLAGKSGHAFDTAFAHGQIHAHRKAVERTRTELHDGESPKIHELADHALPILKKHLRKLKSIAD